MQEKATPVKIGSKPRSRAALTDSLQTRPKPLKIDPEPFFGHLRRGSNPDLRIKKSLKMKLKSVTEPVLLLLTEGARGKDRIP